MAPKKPQNQKPISPDEKARRQLVREIKVLGNHINEPETRIHEYLELSDGSPGGEFAVGYAGSREEECLKFRDNGRVSRTTWQTSGHNGDPYDFKTTELSPEEATRVLTGLRDMLEERAIRKERELLERAAQKRLQDTARKNLRAKLGL
jgi:hypothetical protein